MFTDSGNESTAEDAKNAAGTEYTFAIGYLVDGETRNADVAVTLSGNGVKFENRKWRVTNGSYARVNVSHSSAFEIDRIYYEKEDGSCICADNDGIFFFESSQPDDYVYSLTVEMKKKDNFHYLSFEPGTYSMEQGAVTDIRVETEEGSWSQEWKTVEKGRAVVIQLAPQDGYDVDCVIWSGNGKMEFAREMAQADNEYYFYMPSCDVTVSVYFHRTGTRHEIFVYGTGEVILRSDREKAEEGTESTAENTADYENGSGSGANKAITIV